MKQAHDDNNAAAAGNSSRTVIMVALAATLLVVLFSLPVFTGFQLGSLGTTGTAGTADTTGTPATGLTTSQPDATQPTGSLSEKQILASRQLELDTLAQQLTRQSSEQAALATSLQNRLDQANLLARQRSQLAGELAAKLAQAGLTATVDPVSGSVNLGSTLTFASGNATVTAAGKATLGKFIPVYLATVLGAAWRDKIDLIYVEGFADDGGSYLVNLQLSQNRAYSAMTYLSGLDLDGMSGLAATNKYFVISGQSYSAPVYENGVVNKDLSRRVEFRFVLKDQPE